MTSGSQVSSEVDIVVQFLKTPRPSNADLSIENNVDRMLDGMLVQIKAIRLPSELRISKASGMMDIGISRKVSGSLTPPG